MEEKKPSGIEKVAHFFLSALKRQTSEGPMTVNLPTQKSAPAFPLLAGKERLGLVWMNTGENHLVLSSALGRYLGTQLSGAKKIRVVSFGTSYGCWERLRSYSPSLSRFLPLNGSSRATCLSLSPEVELIHMPEGRNSKEWEGLQQGRIDLVSLSGREKFLGSAFFQQVDQVIFIVPPDRAGLTQLYQALKWVSLKTPRLPTGVLLDGTGFSCSNAWDFFRDYQSLVRRLLARNLDFYGLCDSKGVLRDALSAEALQRNISLF